MTGLFSNLFNRQLKPITTSAVKSNVKWEDDPWEQRVVVQDKEGLAKLTDEAASIAVHEHQGTSTNVEGQKGRIA